MTILAIALGLAVLMIAARLALPRYRRWRLEAELRGDWWTRFETDFRSYSHRHLQAAREAERRE
jgi:hypothetical protein